MSHAQLPSYIFFLLTNLPHNFADYFISLTGMLFTLSVGLHNIPLTTEDKAKASPPYQVHFESCVHGIGSMDSSTRKGLTDSSD